MVRYATEEDAGLIAALDKQVFPKMPLSLPGCRLEVAHGRAWLSEGQGYVLTRWGPSVVDITRLGVVEEWRGKGLGRYLLRLVLLHADMPVILTVEKTNRVALELYRKEGFKPIAHLLHGYDAFLMRRG